MVAENKNEDILQKKEAIEKVKEIAREEGLSKEETEKLVAVANVVGGMEEKTKRVFIDIALAGGSALLGAGAFYGITKALDYSYVRPDDVVEGFQLPSQDGTITTTKQKISFSRKVDDRKVDDE